MATQYPKKPMDLRGFTEVTPGAYSDDPNAASVPQRPEDMLHNMKTDARAREMEQIRAMRPDPAADIQFKPYMPVLDEEGSFDSGDVQQGIYDGAGGYRYEVSSDGSVTIVEAPMNRGVGTVLTRGMAYDAIMEELSQSTPNVSERLDETLADLKDAPDLGADDFDVSDPEPESEMASGPQKMKPLTPAARLAFLRTKARNKRSD
tara:strand:- start:21912 stop:22526 length:615 start_codon:yes stop_codon:yes gene_type:complete